MPTLRHAALPILALLISSPALAQEARSAPASDSAGPDAASKQEAARRFEHAIKLYEDSDYTLALAEFERVYELVPNYRVLYNIGQVSIQLGRYARAYRVLQEYVTRGGTALPPDRAKAVQDDLTQLAGKIARLSVEVAQDGAQVSIDGTAVGRSPLAEPLVVDVGEHRVDIELAGYATQSRSFTLAGGDRREAAFTLRPAEASAAPLATPTTTTGDNKPRVAVVPKSSAASHRGTWVGVGWASTGALAAGAIVSGALGASAAGDLRDLRDGATSRTALDQAQNRARTRLLIADVLGGAALIAGGITLYVQLSGPSRDKAPQTAAAPRWQLRLGANQVALALEN